MQDDLFSTYDDIIKSKTASFHGVSLAHGPWLTSILLIPYVCACLSITPRIWSSLPTLLPIYTPNILNLFFRYFVSVIVLIDSLGVLCTFRFAVLLSVFGVILDLFLLRERRLRLMISLCESQSLQNWLNWLKCWWWKICEWSTYSPLPLGCRSKSVVGYGCWRTLDTGPTWGKQLWISLWSTGNE